MSETTFKYRHTKTDKYLYPDGMGGSLWINNTDCESPDCDCDDCGIGLCFDFGEENVDEIIKALQEWKTKEHIVYEEDKEYQAILDKAEEKENTWWYKLWDWANDFTITIRPFEWAFYFKTRSSFNMFFSIPSSRSRGFQLGPLQVTTPKIGKKKKG